MEKGASNRDSPYKQMMQKLFEEYRQVQEQYQIPGKEVAKVILNADILDNRNQRYIVGKYGEIIRQKQK